MGNELWRWADPDGQQRRVRLDELRAALAGGHIAPNTPVWRSGWKDWQPAHDVPELTTSALSAANGVVQNIPPPPLAVVAVQHQWEAQASESFRPPPVSVLADDEQPPPPPSFVPQPVRAASVPPIAAAHPASSREPSSLPTTVGLPPPPELAAMATAAAAKRESGGAAMGSVPTPFVSSPLPPGAIPTAGQPIPSPLAAPGLPGAAAGKADPMIEELSGSMLLDESPSIDRSRPLPQNGGMPASGLPPPTDPIVRGGSGSFDLESAGLPPRRPTFSAIFDDFQEIKAGRPPKNKRLVAVVGVLGLSVAILFVALVASAFRSNPSDPKAVASAKKGSSGSPDETSSGAPGTSTGGAGTEATTTQATQAAAAQTAAAQAAAAQAAAAPTAKDEPAAAAGGDCSVAGDSHVIAPKVFTPSGVEALSVPGAVALGFAVTPRDGVALTVDPTSLSITTQVKARAAGGDARRVSPVLSQGKLLAVPDVDKKDKLLGRRVIGTSPLIDIGIAEGAVVWAPHGQNSYAKLFPLDADGATTDALRGISLGSGKGIAVAFRHGNAIHVGIARGDAVLQPEGSVARIAGSGQVGSPSLATSGEAILLAFADRGSAADAWQVRWTKVTTGGVAEAAKSFAVPEGGLGAQAMSPSLAGLGGGRFLLTWTEGAVANHQVRAVTMNAEGAVSGAPLSVSAAGVNAGQSQVAVGPDGRGVIGFLAKAKAGFEVHATPVTCPAK